MSHLQTARSQCFELALASGSKGFSQTSYLAYPAADGDWFDLLDRANRLKIFAALKFHRIGFVAASQLVDRVFAIMAPQKRKPRRRELRGL